MIDVQMPQLGESVAEGTVTQWHVKPGDFVRREQPLLEVATDKADSEVPSPSDGVVVKLVANEGDIVPTGGVLCTIDETASAGKEAPKEQPKEKKGDGKKSDHEEAEGERTLTSPSTRKLAREEGVDLRKLEGTGERGRITREDVQRAARQVSPPSAPPSMPGAPPSRFGYETVPAPAEEAPRRQAQELTALLNADTPVPGVGYRSYKVPPYKEKPGDKVVPFSRRRRITADHMVYSQHVAPHVVTVAEIDLFAVDKIRNQHKDAFKKEGISLTYLAFVVAAVVKALREYPTLNARVLDDSYVVFKDINTGIAVDTPNGLLVANIKNADQLSMRGIAAAIEDVATRARDGKITADDLMGTTFTISNPGRKGNLFGGAIISQPNVAILRIGEIKKRPVVVDKDGDDVIAIHPVMFAALSYDHRIVDGVEANAFLWSITDLLGRGEVEV
ncbi:MAG TPA: dihydrolipoamide acetyltransferase family protein [Polyangiaceae bacterium]|nr:dihydrolipoamide acetyltransferase family protein [Polyangiaceae bacterium]